MPVLQRRRALLTPLTDLRRSQTPSLDASFFRETFVTSPSDGSQVVLHPAIEEAIFTFSSPEDAVVFGKDYSLEHPLLRLPCWKENATSPPVDEVFIYDIGINGGEVGAGSGPGGAITVKDVVKTVAMLWSAPIGEEYEVEDCSEEGYDEVITVLDAFMRYTAHNAWTNWDSSSYTVREGGWIGLVPGPYDS